MTEPLRLWLDGRSPRPPADLRERLADALEVADPLEVDAREASTTADALLQAARSALGSASSRTGRVRETAFHLLVADALVTYACEAALESEAPEEVLASVLAIGRSGIGGTV